MPVTPAPVSAYVFCGARMKKEKGKKEKDFKFEPSDYDYMDSFVFAGMDMGVYEEIPKV